MAWIKRNLYFVITAVVALGLAGYGGYLFYSAYSETANTSNDYATALASLTELDNQKPFPSSDNIKAAEEEKARMTAFQSDFRKPFSSFPTPPKTDDREFSDYVRKTVIQFGAAATNAGVGVIPGYAFGFSQQVTSLNYPADSIPGWMGEIQEINAILQILFKAKINYLEAIKRPPVAESDGGPDIVQFTTNTTPWGTMSPYRLEFRAFSGEIANVLEGFASSSNCYIVKGLYVKPSNVPIEYKEPPPPQTPQQMPRQPRPNFGEGSPGGRGERGGGRDFRAERRAPTPQMQQADAADMPVGPVTILREAPLFVTLYLDIVKLKPADVPPPAKPAGRARSTEH